MSKLRLLACAMILALLSVLVLAPASHTHAQSTTNSVNTVQSITGTAAGAPFTGTFTLTNFQVINGVLNAVGTITGIPGTTGAVPVNIPITGASTTGPCQILHL